MIIVSQDRKKITDRMELYIDLAIKNKYGIFYDKKDGTYTCLGLYETEERAMEVLQEIIELYKKNDIEIGNIAHRMCTYAYPKVYEMPEE